MTSISRKQFFDFIKTEKDTGNFITNATQHYLDYFDKYQDTGKKGNCNWSAFFFFSMWLLYRKMDKYAIPLIIFNLVYLLCLNHIWNLMAPIVNGSDIVAYGIILIHIIINLLILRYSDYLYLRYILNTVEKENIIYSGVMNKTSIVIIAYIYFGFEHFIFTKWNDKIYGVVRNEEKTDKRM
jgi:hypothetical protein